MSGSLFGTLLLLDGARKGNVLEELAGLSLMNNASSAADNRSRQQRQRELQLRERELQLAWQENRATRTLASNTLLASAKTTSEAGAVNKLEELKRAAASYDNNSRFMDDADRGILAELNAAVTKFKAIVQAQKDNVLQAKVHVMIAEVHKLLNQGNVPAALKCLSDARAIVVQIHDMRNIRGQDSTPVSDFVEPLATLKQQKTQFEIRARDIATAIAEEIFDNATKDLRAKDGSKGVLYSVHASQLREKLRLSFIQSWSKFDQREIPEHLKLNLQRIISSRRKDIGNKKYIHDLGRANISIDKIDVRLQEIDNEIAAYIPESPAPQIVLNIGVPIAIEVKDAPKGDNGSPNSEKKRLVMQG